ncbi:hypothetical protein [Spiroplasma ixodetis]|uniref:Transmembrane protein n=1 Tax=Spiroplasma ixodetis TaxID=2141 RepID=A0ABN6T3N0_9MOLU|nr:hypothetical protein [Spiroplasma ixodetis]BDT04964.1 hypothetical protein SHM_26100 [Spiroplasma ixodetis]
MKTWIKANLSKITLALALTGAVSGVTGLIIGSISHHKTNDLTYFLNHDHTAVWGNTTIWKYKSISGGEFHYIFQVNQLMLMI